ncbi:MAG: hypothetical protein DRI86_05650 [Bacteroidetes bacterium]|nr:MAG: hypothetical protein DRI86_05650 [Bacteroidota bacterium]
MADYNSIFTGAEIDQAIASIRTQEHPITVWEGTSMCVNISELTPSPSGELIGEFKVYFSGDFNGVIMLDVSSTSVLSYGEIRDVEVKYNNFEITISSITSGAKITKIKRIQHGI